MSKRVKVRLFGFQNRHVTVDADATEGAVVGRDLYWQDGSVVTEDEIRGGSTVTEVIEGGVSTTPSVSIWGLILNIPDIIKNIADLATNGLMVHTGSGNIVTRLVESLTTNRITVTDGDGVAGNVGLTVLPWITVKQSVGAAETCWIEPGYQLLVAESFDVEGTLNAEGTLVVL